MSADVAELARIFVSLPADEREQLMHRIADNGGECADAWLKILYVKHLELCESEQQND